MGIKKRLLTILGAFFLLAGILLVAAVLSAWLITPAIPSEAAFYSTAATNQSQNDWGSGSALSPIEPTADVDSQALDQPIVAAVQPTKTTAPPNPNVEPTSQQVLPPTDMGNNVPSATTSENPVMMRMIIPDIGVDAPLVSVHFDAIIQGGRQDHAQWQVPDSYAAGWHSTSAPIGQPGNSVINGHNNIHGAIFHDLVDLPLGARIIIETGDQIFEYQVTGREFLLERGEPLRDRLRNARWISPTDDERVTIVTCWPNSSNSHRLVVVAHPVDQT